MTLVFRKFLKKYNTIENLWHLWQNFSNSLNSKKRWFTLFFATFLGKICHRLLKSVWQSMWHLWHLVKIFIVIWNPLVHISQKRINMCVYARSVSLDFLICFYNKLPILTWLCPTKKRPPTSHVWCQRSFLSTQNYLIRFHVQTTRYGGMLLCAWPEPTALWASFAW